MIIWLIGLSGTGKTTIGQRLFAELKKSHDNLVFLDGDILREVWEEPLGHDIEGRGKNAHRISRFCRLLDRQGIHVITSILSIFPDWQAWNRKNFSQYFEVFIDMPRDILFERDPKGLYQKALAGEIKNVCGVDIEFPIPANADLVIENSKELEDPSSLALEILPIVKPLMESAASNEEEHSYSYSEGNLLEDRNTYFYTNMCGEDFFKLFDDARAKSIPGAIEPSAIEVPETEPPHPGQTETQTAGILDWLVFHWTAGNARGDIRDFTGMMVRRFEISKRIHAAYDINQKPLNRDDYEDYCLYLRTAEMFVLAFKESGTIQYLNALLKIMDTITSFVGRLDQAGAQRHADLVRYEKAFVEELRSTCQ